MKIAGLAGMIAAATLVAGTAQAQTNVTGSTTGCFGVGCTAVNFSSYNGGTLTYTGSTFDVTTVDGSASVGAKVGTPNVNNLGSFFLSATPTTYNTPFTLFTTFTSPVGAPDATFQAVATGTVVGDANGFFKIMFNPNSQVFNFDGGSFTYEVQANTFITPGDNVPLTGQFTGVTTTPEPSSMALLGTGLVGLVPIFRRRRK